METLKLIVFGSARIDAFLDVPIDKVDKLCNIDTHRCVVEFTYGAKIPMNNVQFLLGGNGANVSVGTKRMGIESALVAELGQGVMADHAKRELVKEINTQYVTQTYGVREGFGAVIIYQGERTILSYYSPEQPPFPADLCGAEWTYLTSTGENFEDYYEKVYSWLASCSAKLVFNPGGRQIAKGTEWLAKYLAKTELLFSNREEAEQIVGMNESQGKEKELLQKLNQMGVKIAVITDGGNGSFAFNGTDFFKAGVMPIDSIERTGAGDAFSTGCMSALILGKTLEVALIWGTLNSSSVIGYYGPQKGLLTGEKLGEWLQMADSSGLKVEKF